MIITRVVTESGSIYEFDFDKGFWRKPSQSLAWYKIYWCFSFIKDEDIAEFFKGILPVEFDRIEEPVIGKRMYISGKDHWWVTTPVVDILFVENEFDK